MTQFEVKQTAVQFVVKQKAVQLEAESEQVKMNVDNAKPVVVSNAKIGVVELLASKWVGEENAYSQIVTIGGVTPNSQVDLTPSAEQLMVFYDKSLAFVAENEDGIVTVYAIGQKPENDYTIQVTITEVGA